MRVRAFIFSAVLLGAAAVSAETLPLPDELIALASNPGAALLFEAEARDDFLPLSEYFVTQDNPAFCGPASISMVLNALDVPRPPSEMTLGLGLFDQDNLFTAAAEAAKPKAEVLQGGMTLDELAADARRPRSCRGADSRRGRHVDAFREAAASALDDPDRFVLVNYLRSAIGQETGGHISPLAAYDADSDRFLILDVSRYKYPPVWVETAALYDAMNTIDSTSGLSRGYVLVGPGG